jgi:hypothetical protein
MDQKDLAFIAQNSGGHAATITTALIAAGQVSDSVQAGHAFAALREDIFNGALELLDVSVEAVTAQTVADAAARVAANFPASGPSTTTAAPTPAASGGRVKVRKPLDGQPLPDWLEKQVEWLIGKGDIPDTSTVELWDNRGFLPEFGGDKNPRGPWFTTVEKPAGSQYGVGIWPPKKR